MPQQTKRQPYGYLRAGDRVEVYTLSGRRMGVVDRVRQVERHGKPRRIPHYVVDGTIYRRLVDAADALVRMERSEG